MSGHSSETEGLRETLIDFAIWGGDSRDDAEWSTETYLRESSTCEHHDGCGWCPAHDCAAAACAHEHTTPPAGGDA